ncbi:MAG TPA: hypothetical protein VNR60_00350 [Croceibacterium sp.]|nr:hypothetical protein [Croceibacterium sp.]
MHQPIRPLLLAGCAATALLATPLQTARAQAFAGTGDIVTGIGSIGTMPDSGPDMPATTEVTVFTPETVINWSAVDTAGSGAIDFLPEGTLARFVYDGSGDFTVLNRVLPVDINSAPTAATISLNGAIESSAAGAPGGNIWFYSPTGIFVGPNARIDVGSLVLTTNDIQFTPNEFSDLGTIYGPGGLVEFRGADGSTGRVEIAAGAEINAVAFDSYVALVAPRIVQNGTVTANRNVAYIAAEQVDMFIDTGLFDFTVTVGTTDGNGIVHTGTTTGTASSGTFDAKQIAMVAVPKNDALTMLLSGTIGYQPAIDVTDEGGTVVLAAGFTSANPTEFAANQLGSISIGDATFNNRVSAYATDGIDIQPLGGTTEFVNSTTLYAGNRVALAADAGGTISARNFTIYSARPGIGGTIDLTASEGGSISSDGAMSFYASNLSAPFSIDAPFTDGQGGQVNLLAEGGAISALSIYATAEGTGSVGTGTGGVGRGGAIDARVAAGGSITASTFSLYASGYGGESFDDASVAGDGFGGTISLVNEGGALNLTDVTLTAEGRGAYAVGQSGDGTGGAIAIDIAGGTHNWDRLFASASGAGGEAVFSGSVAGAGTARADAIRLTVSGTGELVVSGDIILQANASSGFNGAASFTNQAGGIRLEALTSGTISANAIQLNADARTIAFSSFSDPVVTPIQRGGTVEVVSSGGEITTSYLGLSASAFGSSAAATAGSATGGTARATAIDGGSIFIDGGNGGLVQLDGGAGIEIASGLTIVADGFGAPGAVASNATGGTANLIAQDGTIEVLGDIIVSASARSLTTLEELDAPGPRAGPTLTGGNATVELLAGSAGTASITANALTIQAVGDGRTNYVFSLDEFNFFENLATFLSPSDLPVRGSSGSGTGGTAQLVATGGSLSLDTLTVDANGLGGKAAASDGATAYQAGDGTGGTARVSQTGGTIEITSLQLSASGLGGGAGGNDVANSGSLAALAGAGAGGTAVAQFSGGSLTTQDMTVMATGTGGAGMNHGGGGTASSGGNGTGGTARVESLPGSTANLSATTLSIQATGSGGAGGFSGTGTNGNGGNGVGSIATFALGDGAFALGTVEIDATGIGGDSGDANSGLPGAVGGEGSGGQAGFTVTDTPGPVGPRGIGTLSLNASGTGGSGSTAEAESDAGTARLNVATLNAASAIELAGDLMVESTGTRAGATAGIEATVSGAPFAADGSLLFDTSGRVIVNAAQPLSANGAVRITGNSFTSTGLIEAGEVMEITVANGIAADRLSSGGPTLLQALDGTLVVNDLASAGAVILRALDVSIDADEALLIEEATASNGALSITTGGALTTQLLNTSGAVTLSSGADLQTADTVIGSSISLTATGDIIANGSLQSDGAIVLNAGGDLQSLEGVNGGSVSLTAGGNVITNGPLSADAALTVDAGGVFAMSGTGRGTTISVTSADINLGLGGTLGERGTTQELTIIARVPAPTGSANRIFIGGETLSGDYSLDSAEATRLFADNAITFRSVGTGAAVTDITIGNLALSYGASGNIGTGGTLEISGPTRIAIDGNVALTTSSATDTFLIDPTLVELNTETGSIAMLDPSGAALGQVHIVGDTIAIATGNVLGQLQTLTSFPTINAALDQPGGNPQAISASSITFDVTDGLFIQNSGASTEYADRGGFIAETISINTASGATRIAVNGQLVNQGQPIGGIDVIPLVSINGASGTSGGLFNPASTINGCLIVGACSTMPGMNTPGLPRDTDLLTPLKAESEGAVTGGGELFITPLIELAPVEPLISPPLVDEPITGVGNDDLWDNSCDPTSDSCSTGNSDR